MGKEDTWSIKIKKVLSGEGMFHWEKKKDWRWLCQGKKRGKGRAHGYGGRANFGGGRWLGR